MWLYGCPNCSNKRKSGPYSKIFRSLQMSGFQFVVWNNLRFPLMCQNMVSRRLTGACTSTCNKTSLLAVRLWIFYDRIVREIIWTPILPGRNGDWRQHLLIRNIIASCDGCDGGTESGPRRLEDWVGTSSENINRGGRHRKIRAAAPLAH
jgi:hypothetical protein